MEFGSFGEVIYPGRNEGEKSGENCLGNVIHSDKRKLLERG